MLLIICKWYCFWNCHDNWSISLPWLIPKHIAKVHSSPIHVYWEESPIEWSLFSFKLTEMYLGRKSNRWVKWMIYHFYQFGFLLTSKDCNLPYENDPSRTFTNIFFSLHSNRRYEAILCVTGSIIFLDSRVRENATLHLITFMIIHHYWLNNAICSFYYINNDLSYSCKV